MNRKCGVGSQNQSAVPDWKLERYLLGELPTKEMEAIRKLEEADVKLRERIAELRENNAELLAKYPPEFMARRIDAAADSGKYAAPRAKSPRLVLTGRAATSILDGWKSIPRWAALPAFACLLVLLAIPLRLIPNASVEHINTAFAFPADDGIRIKGFESRLEVWRKVGEGAERLVPGADAAEGDVVQLRYLVPEFRYGAIVSLDGRGHLTVHLSGEAGRAVPLTPGRPIALDHSYELDDAQKFEIFYLITAQQNFDTNVAAQAIQRASNKHRPALQRNQEVTVFTLRKIEG
ncbi:MAG: hypothetical protein LBU70_07040 [Chitinispirillales bacterium]|jgi:hypothetical protein|nr:hypothetical protein [Chitinispirillales bacterium]